MDGPVRLYLTGRIAVEVGDHVLTEEQLARRQGRVAFAYLALERSRAVPRDELAWAIWGDDLPDSWDISMSAVISKLRKALTMAGLEGSDAVRTSGGCHQLVLPPTALVDVESAAHFMHEAETLRRAGRLEAAHMPAVVARAVARRPFLPGEDLPWADRVRSMLRDMVVRSLDVLMESHLALDETTEAIQRAEVVLAMEPFRETGWRGLMRAHAAAGNPAEALRAYERCRSVLSDELGVGPAAETRSLHADLLRELASVDSLGPAQSGS